MVNKKRLKCYKITLHVFQNKQHFIIFGMVYFKFHSTPHIKMMQNGLHVSHIIFTVKYRMLNLYFHVSRIIGTLNLFHGHIEHDKGDSSHLRGPSC
jgi:hydrogenase-4 membrane subunit HyfE